MKKLKKIILFSVALVLTLGLFGCKSEKPTFVFEENITLNSDETIDWSNYVQIKVGKNEQDISNAVITLIAGNSKVSGVCKYKIEYTYKNKTYTETFEVTYDYPPVEIEPVITISNEIK